MVVYPTESWGLYPLVRSRVFTYGVFPRVRKVFLSSGWDILLASFWGIYPARYLP